MALTLDLRLTRRGDEAWGFRLIGGVDFKMPLTVVKVQPASPAEAAGLRNGDALLAIGGRRADALTHDAAYDVIKACDRELELEVVRGRYDPVLDDQEPLYDQIDQTDDELVDFVPLSDPSEVFMTIPDLSREPSTNPDAISRGASELADPSRSMTASPFVLPSKPYRPFSTEPIPEVPPLEDPIVLNPNYHDEFGHADDEDFLPKSKFKLPISEQYDPGNEKSKLTKKDSSMRIDLGKKETEMKEDLMFMKQMRQDIDLERMEKSVATVTELTNVAVAASNVVEESLFKAVTVAEEIKKEIDVELTSFESSEVKSSKTEQQAKSTSAKIEFTSNVMESSDVQQSTKAREKTTGDIVKELSKRTKMEVAQSLQTERESVSIKEQESKRDLEETIVAGTVKRLSNNFDKEMVKSATAAVEINTQTTTVKDTQIKESDMKLDKTIAQKDTKSSVTNKQTTKTAQKCAVSETKSQKATKEQNKTKYSTERLLAEQRAYTIGLQTIPNIRGLERGQSTEDERVVRKENIVEQEVLSTQEYSVNDEETVQQQNLGQKQDVIVLVKAEKEQAIDDHELAEKRKISGARMAQMSSHKSEELTEKMEAVINEFQTKSGLEESSEQKTLSLRERRSRSKSKVEEGVSKESDPLEWLSKKEEARQVISDTVQACKAVEEVTESEICVTESNKETSKVDHLTTEKREDRRSKSKDRNTYIAIVESHVYTNKDAILEEHLSGGSSVQDSAEIKQSTENIFLENAQSSKSVEETKQVTKEEVAMETASVNVEETKKLLLEEARKASITEVSKQHVTKIEKEVEISKVQKLAEVSKKVTEPEPIVEEVEEKVVLKMKPAEIIQEDVQATVQILKEMPVSPEIIEISEETSIMSGSRQESSFRSGISTEKFESKTQEVHQTQRSDVNQQTHQLSLELKQEGYKISHSDSFPSTIDTPTPATVPPTPLTDEYVFRLEIPLPKTAGLPPVEEPEASPEKETDHEDLNIVKKKWEIDSPTIQAVVYDPPLPTPLEVKDAPKFSNAVLSEANDGSMSEEEILEIGRKSSLLASAIDETIKCIEEYKEQVGMETKRSISEETKKKDLKIEDITQPMYTGIVAEAKTTVYADAASKTSEDAEKHKENWSKVTEQFKNNGRAAVIISKASECTAKDSFAINSTEIERKDLTSSFGSQNVTETIATSTKPAENIAITTDSIKETFSVKSAVKQNKDVLTSSIVSQNTDAINKLSEYSSSMTDSLMKDAFDSKTTSVESKNVLSSSYETQNLDTSILKSSITAETVRESEKSIDELAKITQSLITQNKELKTDPLQKIRSVPFNPEELKQRAASEEAPVNGSRSVQLNVASNNQGRQLATPRNVVVDGEVLATHQGIISGVEDVIIDEETAKELGKPGLTEERIAEIMSGESEMLREAHVMGLSRVIASHMTRVDENDSSVDFKKIKPTIEKLKDSEVLKALNDELTKTKEEIKKEERKWTTFLQKPDRPQPQAKFGYHGWLPQFIPPQERYKVKIVKQPKPKVAPDYKPEDFETGLLPWELRAATEPPPPPVAAEDPILIPEEGPQFYEAVDPLPESEVPDLEETGIPLPPEKVTAPEPEPELEEPEACPENIKQVAEEEPQEPPAEEDSEEMEQNRLAEQLLNNVQSMVDPNATLEQQLAQMRAQLAALAQLPGVIQQSLELVTRQLMQIAQQESTKVVTQSDTVQEAVEQTEEIRTTETNQETAEEGEEPQVEASRQEHVTQEIQQTRPPEATPEEIERMRREEQEILEEQRRVEKQKKELMEQIQLEQESRQLKQRPTPRVGRPKPAFGPLVPAERPLVLPGGRKWRKPKDAYNEQFIAETLTAQAEIIQGKTKGLSYESVLLPYDGRVNFMKYEKPPVSLDHLKDSDVYKLIHNMEQVPMRRVDMLTPVIAECDYREKCRSVTPCGMAHSHGEHLDMPQQVAP